MVWLACFTLVMFRLWPWAWSDWSRVPTKTVRRGDSAFGFSEVARSDWLGGIAVADSSAFVTLLWLQIQTVHIKYMIHDVE